MSEHKSLYLSRADVETVNLPMSQVIDLLVVAFREKGNGRVEMPPKPGIHTMPDAFIHAMPAYIPAMHSAEIKWVSGYPENFKRGLPYITGLMILNDVETGIPYAVLDCSCKPVFSALVPVKFYPINFSALPSGYDNGTVLYCTECTANSNPCTGSGTGALAKRLNGAWDCR